jgi:hypothetical protein
MNKKRLFALLIVLICTLLVANAGLAMSSTNYALDWFTPLTSGGGGPTSSANYAADVTIGQTAIGKASSTNYRMDLGYWYDLVIEWFVHLPTIMQ